MSPSPDNSPHPHDLCLQPVQCQGTAPPWRETLLLRWWCHLTSILMLLATPVSCPWPLFLSEPAHHGLQFCVTPPPLFKAEVSHPLCRENKGHQQSGTLDFPAAILLTGLHPHPSWLPSSLSSLCLSLSRSLFSQALDAIFSCLRDCLSYFFSHLCLDPPLTYVTSFGSNLTNGSPLYSVFLLSPSLLFQVLERVLTCP